ncbi:Laccase domain protein yfiH [Serratia entomophila]|uniref:peptidoglycan editing factor PgeF n=1 Tax=Serratia entomophila TaxID=42906 RepID=UPI001F27A122|nr:peptidoglycan editing factor PgeF [Serratia entomophila]UIW16548.1 peptidoglycan editing factor PgeF [Serratia entomophila]CAI0691113.1 Laccase domain protein yfiH [Serratia entomophila]CAI0691519.1 Laccase domain protein yfiH [Serratia entomophila]CAI0691525.1 Laccase domain protein yfiH [Serratia entomophila]CAI0731621.1 Laccase domain protein yfiH [Serratia entomophila]
MTDYSPLLEAVPKIRHGFGNKAALLPGHLLPYRATLPEKKQVHGTRIVDVLQPAQPCGEADGFFTRQPGILLSVLTADCLPVLFSRRDGSAIAAVHAGWRGLLDGILEQMAAHISREDATANWVASIGPAAGPCCYEVNEELVENFKRQLPLPAALISPSYRHLDLAAIAEYKLDALGFSAVDRAGSCTICTPDTDPQRPQRFKYTSYRRNSHRRERDPNHPGITGRNQYAGIIIAAE